MTFRTRLDVAHGRIEAAPMVDVVFLLLIFFILSSSFVLQPGIKVDLPASAVKTPGAFQGMVVTVTRADAVFFNERRTSLDELPRELAAAVAHSAGPQELVVKADLQVPHGTVVAIMSMAIQAGIGSINIATRTATPAAGTP